MTIWLVGSIIAHVLGLVSSIHAVMTARTSQGSIAWAISLNTFPYVAVPAYWFLGRSRFAGYITARKDTDAGSLQTFQQIRDDVADYCMSDGKMTGAGFAAEALADFPFLCGNDLELLIDGDATFESILSGIAAAQNYILFQFFIVKDDGLGRRVKAALLSKAAQGVKIYFIYDEVGSKSLPESYKKELANAGVEVYAFNTRKGKGNRFQLNFRNHRKVVVVDGHTSWVGGHNVGDEYLGKDPKFGHWRDTHLRIKGPAALAAQLSFAEDWNWATDRKLSTLNWQPASVEPNDTWVLMVPSSPADEYETAALMFLHAINSAQERIWIASPYFVPDDAIVSALQLAGLRGVDVRILIPDMPDHLLVYLAAFSYFDEASLTGAKIYRYTDGFLHEKAMLIDDHTATVGTANFDNRSFRLNFEITAVVLNSSFAAEVEKMFIDDFENTRLMTRDEIEGKSFWFKLAVRIARLTSPVQ
jgi:cardiolipin synthase